MKRTLGVIVLAALKAGNVAFHYVWNGISTSVRHGKLLQIRKFLTAVSAFFLRHIGCGRHSLAFSLNKLKDRVRIPSNFYFHALHNRKSSAQVKHLETEGYYA